MNTRATLVVASALLWSSSAWAQGAPGVDTSGQEPEGRAQGAGEPAALPQRAGQAEEEAPSSADAQFLADAYSINQGEVRLGKLAQTKGKSDAVKNFGRRMVNDHTLAIKELADAAKDARMKMPDTLRPEEKELYQRLSQLSGAEFDREYLTQMVQAHADAIATFERQARDGQNEVLRAYAEKQLPILRAHHEVAKIDEREASTSDTTSSSAGTSGVRGSSEAPSSGSTTGSSGAREAGSATGGSQAGGTTSGSPRSGTTTRSTTTTTETRSE